MMYLACLSIVHKTVMVFLVLATLAASEDVLALVCFGAHPFHNCTI